MPAQVASARIFRYKAALREYSEARRGIEPDRQWQAMLLIVTAADSLWEKARPYIDFAAGSAYLDQLRQEVDLTGGEALLIDLARNLFNRGAEVDLAGLADTLDGTLWPVVLEALALYRGEATDVKNCESAKTDPGPLPWGGDPMSLNKTEGPSNVRLEVNVWLRDDGQIGISSNTGNFITTVNDRIDSKRGHPNLFGHLKQVLKEAGRWPEGAE